MIPSFLGKIKKRSSFFGKGWCLMDKKSKDKSKSTLSSMQEVVYSREFKLADQAGGFTKKKSKH